MNVETALLAGVNEWARSQSSVQAIVLYGSAAREHGALGAPDQWSDIDLHAVANFPAEFEKIDWGVVLPGHGYCLRAVRGASGGVRKLTMLFSAGELEIVVLPASQLRLARLAMRLGLHKKIPSLRANLNVLATGLRGGFRFLKGEDIWGNFYRRVASDMPGIRLNDDSARGLANTFLCDFLCLLKRLERGELLAAQHALHQRLSETNFTLVRELRLLRGLPLPSFEVGRRLESLMQPDELDRVRIDARPDVNELHRAAWRSFSAMKDLMAQIDADWAVPAEVLAMLTRHSGNTSSR